MVLTVKAIPKSSRDEIAAVLEDGSLKVKVTAAPEKGKANLAICAVLAAAFDVPRGNVEIVRGANAALKQVVISGG